MSAVKRLPKVDLTHHWLVSMRGGEKVLEQFCLLFPESTITMLVADKSRLEGAIRSAPVRTSFLQAIGGARYYKKMLPLFPLAAGSLTVGSGSLHRRTVSQSWPFRRTGLTRLTGDRTWKMPFGNQTVPGRLTAYWRIF